MYCLLIVLLSNWMLSNYMPNCMLFSNCILFNNDLIWVRYIVSNIMHTPTNICDPTSFAECTIM